MFFLPNQTGYDHEFVYRSTNAGVKRVTVAGVFNNWSQDASPMKLDPDGRTWTLHLRVPLGKIQYKFVLDGSNWVLDPNAPSVPDGNGHVNSVIAVIPEDYKVPASPNDGIIAVSALKYDQAEPDLNYDRGRLRFLFRARPGDLASVTLQVNGQKLPMTELWNGEFYETYQAQLPWDRKTDLRYEFALKDGPRTAYYGAGGLETKPSDPFRLSAKAFKPFEVPGWVEKSVIYQIFPDRFADGDKSNDPPDVTAWGAKPTYSNFCGGDVAGVRQHLDYLSGLGIGAVYFNPIFESHSDHRYDAIDFRKVDPRFGTNEEFYSLTKAMQARGIRSVMDFAFNHSSPDFFAFRDIRDKGPASAYTNWYFIKSYPVVVKDNPPYVAWFGFPSMPKLNTVNPATHQYLLDTVDFWKKNAALSGLRLDVPNEVDSSLWRDMRSRLKGYAPDTWICGEIWGDGNPWLGGDQFDSVMGYQFRDAAIAFFAESHTKPSEFLNRLMEFYGSYPPQVSRNLMNLLDSHDTERFLTSCHGNRDLQLLAATVEFTWPGAPTIYYGDELGMEGGKDPDNRRCVDWSLNTPQNSTLQYYRKLVQIRNHTPALQSGDPAVLFTNDSERTFAYSRTLGKDWAIVAVNASSEERTLSVPVPARAPIVDQISGRRYNSAGRIVTLHLPPLRAAVLVIQEPSTHSSLRSAGKTLRQVSDTAVQPKGI